jgi:hypothetical protein
VAAAVATATGTVESQERPVEKPADAVDPSPETATFSQPPPQSQETATESVESRSSATTQTAVTENGDRQNKVSLTPLP